MALLYISDLFTGLFAALAFREIPVLSFRTTHLAHTLEKLWENLVTEAEREHLLLRFRLRMHPVHRDSTEIQNALWEARQRGLVSVSSADVRINISRIDAPRYLAQVPGSKDMYHTLAERFVTYYQKIETV